jgi:GH3 auxin-responsive promoter
MIRSFIQFLVRRRLRRLDRVLRDPARTQEQVLLAMVRKAAATEWGRTRAYDRIRTVSDYQKATRPNRYEEMAPLWHRAFQGERDLAWPGHIRYFSLTSGTTLGASKAMPVSTEAIRMNQRAGLSLLGHIQRQAPSADLAAGQTLYFGGCTRLTARGACWQGDASGINALHVPRLARRFRLPESDISDLDDWEAKVSILCRRYLDHPVRAIVGLPSWTLILFRALIDHGRERLGAHVNTVSDVWPDLAVFVHFGMAFEPYRSQFEAIVGKPIAFIDTYSSSEGGLNAIQSEPGDPGMQIEVDGGVFFEFVPLEHVDRPDAPRLTLDQVELDRPYAVLLTTVSGMWAYHVGDAVRFTSLRPPKFVFASRTDFQLNVFGEHVLQEHLDQAVAAACEALGTTVRDFTVESMLPTPEDPRGGHRFLLEFAGPTPSLAELTRRLDECVARASTDYASHRAGDYGLKPPEAVALSPGTFYAWAGKKDKLGGQHKIPRIVSSPIMADELMELSRTLAASG